MVSTLILLPLLAGCASAQLGQGFVPGALASIGDLAAQQAYLQDLLNIINQQQQYSALQVQAQHAARTKRSPQLGPGWVPGNLPTIGDLAAQQAYLQDLLNVINGQQQYSALQVQAQHAARTKRSPQLVPGALPALGSLEQQQAYLLELQNYINFQQQFTQVQLQAQHAARTKRSPQLVPGALPALGSLQQQQEYLLELQNYINFQQQFTQVQLQSLHAARTRRSVPIPGSPEVAALTTNPVAAAYWYGIQLQELQNQLNAQAAALGAASGRRRRSLPVPGSAPVASLTYKPAARADWYLAQLQHQQNLVNQKALELGAAGGK